MSMMGEMKFFLGFEIKQLREGTFINQAKYLQDMLKRFKMTELKGVATPMVTKCHLALDPNGKEVDQKKVKGGPEGCPGGPTHGGRAGCTLAAPAWCEEAPWPLRLRLFAYISPFDLKSRHRLMKLQKDSRGTAAIAKLQFGTESLFGTPPGRGSAPEAISINATASIMLRE
ncbi:hypothetical protein QYE76_061873 [Lolium multiflorum]|uniref:Reverse transcriptase Ty1/copia-type domain-containing protein n=1 Tax=Lolium multiflorum TaxID=4521 RepID=A0AAD8S358_LOLMU|nr:hypothetical protein QYE76_061873 [Lolium multiflorum]